MDKHLNGSGRIEAAKQVIQQAPEMMAQIQETVGQKMENFRKGAVNLYETSEKTVRQNPFYFVAGATALGLVGGYLMARRHNSQKLLSRLQD